MKKEKRIITVTIGILCFLLTMVIFMQFKVVNESRETNLDTMKEAELRQELANWKLKYDETKNEYNEVMKTVDSYKQESSTDVETKNTLEEELDKLELRLGVTDVKGEGIIITLSEKNENELDEDESIISIVADDLIYIVNYLIDSGAEAISINDERIVSSTDIANVGDAIKINSKYLRTNKYIIKAIGNSAYLESSISGKGGYAEQLEITGIKSNIERNSKVEIYKYDDEFEVKYMEVSE